MLKKINCTIYKNTELFQKISDNQAAFISGGMEINIPYFGTVDTSELPDFFDQLNSGFVPNSVVPNS